MIDWPFGSKPGDRMRVDINIMRRTSGHIVIASNYTETGIKGNSPLYVGWQYLVDYPNNLYLMFTADDYVGGDFNFWIWYQPNAT